MNKFYQFSVALLSILFVSCSSGKSKIIIQNLSRQDSLGVIVYINGSEIFNESVPKLISNFDAVSKEFVFKGGMARVKVEVPALNLTASLDSNIQGLSVIFISIRPGYIPNAKLNSNDSVFIRKERVTISLRRDVEKGKAY
jgi:hypothetical protein